MRKGVETALNEIKIDVVTLKGFLIKSGGAYFLHLLLNKSTRQSVCK